MNQEPEFLDYFSDLQDHRINRRKLYSVKEILLLTICAVISGCHSWDDIELYGKTKLEQLKLYLPYNNGTPSDDTLRRFFRAFDTKTFEECFIKWVKSFQLNFENSVIAIDGKTSRHSFDCDNNSMHMVSAFASEFGIVMGQYKTCDKSNEITAIPELLNLLDIKGSIVTIDAMGTQYRIADQIIAAEADYILALKGNQSSLKDDVQAYFANPCKEILVSCFEAFDKGHGRLEKRCCKVIKDIDWIKDQHPQWNSINAIIEVESTRDIKTKQTVEKRYYISSADKSPEKLLNSIRSHWGIENRLHWILDMTYDDDYSRIRKGNAPQNMATVKKISMNMIRGAKQLSQYTKKSFKLMRKLAGWDNKCLNDILFAKF